MSYMADRITYYLVEKTELVYGRVERRFNIERVDELPHNWLGDTSHSVPHCNIGVAFSNPADAMHEVARLYREALLSDSDAQLEVWVDKDAPQGYVPLIAGLYACRGFATLSLIHNWAAIIHYCDAYRACGAADKIAETLAELADEPILAQRLSVMPEQIAVWPARLRRYRGLEFISVPPADLCQRVREAVEYHLPREEFEILNLAKESERQMGKKWDPWEWRPG